MGKHGWVGLGLIAGAMLIRWWKPEEAFFQEIYHWVGTWFTPIVWWGYILFLDAWLQRWEQTSWIRRHPGEFGFMLVASNGCWLIFEGYNLVLKNWEYVHLPKDPIEEWVGSAAAYATIFPGIFWTASVLAHALDMPLISVARPLTRRARLISILVGIVMLVGPLMAPASLRPYLFAPVWLGFIFLLDPWNERMGGVSLLAQVKARNWQWVGVCMGAGYICGFLWEYWNSWATARWIYTIPFPAIVRIYEMPLLGFIGFGPFALECFCMYETCRLLWRRLASKPTFTDHFVRGATVRPMVWHETNF